MLRPQPTFKSLLARLQARAVAVALACAASLFATAQENPPSKGEIASEGERLKQMLLRYHDDASADRPAEGPLEDTALLDEPVASESDLAAQLALPFSAEKVLLREDELALVIDEVEGRLADPRLNERRNNAPMIAAVQNRRSGALVANTTFSFTHLGKHQFLTRVGLSGGGNVVTVAEEQWRIDLPPAYEASPYLVFLYAPPIGDWRIHALPAVALESDSNDLPSWLSDNTALDTQASETP